MCVLTAYLQAKIMERICKMHHWLMGWTPLVVKSNVLRDYTSYIGSEFLESVWYWQRMGLDLLA